MSPNASSCVLYSEASHTKTMELGAEKGLLQVQARRTSGSGSKDLNSKDTTEFQRRVFKDKGRKRSCIVYMISLGALLWLMAR